MNVLIILGHPKPGSFNHALAETCKAQLVKYGHTVFYHDLYKEQFNPVLGAENNLKNNDIKQYCTELVSSDGIIIIHPNWWGQPPAIVKGWLDRVFLPEVAYKFILETDGSVSSKGLLKTRVALVLNTSNTPEELEESIFKDPLETIYKNRVFHFCGVPNFIRKNFRVVKDSNSEQRLQWLSEVQQIINDSFPKD
jgi:NAD(P)H dehydrogenase (quinone)